MVWTIEECPQGRLYRTVSQDRIACDAKHVEACSPGLSHILGIDIYLRSSRSLMTVVEALLGAAAFHKVFSNVLTGIIMPE